MGNECVISSTDVGAITLRYMWVLLIDLQINVCVRRSSFIPRHGTQYCYHVSVLFLARHGSVTADRAQPTCPKSLFIVIDQLRSPAHSLATRGLSILALAMRMSPPPPGVIQCTPDPGHPDDQVPWTLWRLYDRIRLIVDESFLLLECFMPLIRSS